MIIKKVTIENFLCYYGIKEFNFSKGLNIILGENGEGKTKFFDAIETMKKETVDFFKEHLSEIDGETFWNRCKNEFPYKTEKI